MRIEAPKSVLLSVVLLLAAHLAALWPVVVWAQNSGVPPLPMYTVITVACALLVIWLFFIVIGKSWARTTYTIFAVLGLLGAFVRLSEFDALAYILWVVRASAVILLYIPTSDSWFMRRSPDNSSNPNLQP
jgi:hypothetical protein